MGWLELLRLFAEDQNRATAEANREYIKQIAETMLQNNQVFTIGFSILAGVCIFLTLTYNSHRKKIKRLEELIGKNFPK